MAVVKNHFETTVTDDTINTGESYSVTGLISETSSATSINLRAEIALYFLRSVYKTLLDAGYTDVIKNELDYSLNIFGFKFFVINTSYSNNSLKTYNQLYPYVYIYGKDKPIAYVGSGTDRSILLSGTNNLSFNIIVRGSANCVSITYNPADHPLLELPIIFIAKAKNLITSEEAFFCFNSIRSSNTSDYYIGYIRNKENLFQTFPLIANYLTNGSKYGELITMNGKAGLNTTSKFVCEPVTCYYGSFLIHSVLKCNEVNFNRMKYYKIGSDVYYSYGIIENGTTASTYTAPLLIKVS